MRSSGVMKVSQAAIVISTHGGKWLGDDDKSKYF